MKKQNNIIDYRKAICNDIKNLMKNKGITYELLALRTGFNSSNIFRMLNGPHSITIDNLIKLILALNADLKIIEKHT